MALFPYGLIPWIEMRFMLMDGLEPNALGSIQTFLAGTSTPYPTYSDVEGTENATTIDLDAGGRPSLPIFLGPVGYKFVVYDSDDTELYTIDDIEDIGLVFANNIGTLQTAGSKDVTDGYIVLSTDRLITADTTGGPDPGTMTLCAASDFSGILVIKNVGSENLEISPDGSDTIEGAVTPQVLPASSPPAYTTIVLISDGVSNWWIFSAGSVSPKMQVGVFADLPASPVVGETRGVTDSTTAVWGATIAGGGANAVGAIWNGSNWTVWAK